MTKPPGGRPKSDAQALGETAFTAFWMFTLSGILALIFGDQTVGVASLYVGMGSVLIGATCAIVDVRNDIRQGRSR